jgi:hypothetical protein
MKSSVNNGYKIKQKLVFKFHILLTMIAGETIKVESPMGFYQSPTGVLLSHCWVILGVLPPFYKNGDMYYFLSFNRVDRLIIFITNRHVEMEIHENIGKLMQRK